MPTQTALARLIRPRWSVSAILWICVLGIMASFQTWRGAYVDGVLFYAITLMLILDRLTDGRIRLIKTPMDASRWRPTRVAPLAEMLDHVMRLRTTRVGIIAAWWWFGWHFLFAPTIQVAL
jgi:hypothetical protein